MGLFRMNIEYEYLHRTKIATYIVHFMFVKNVKIKRYTGIKMYIKTAILNK